MLSTISQAQFQVDIDAALNEPIQWFRQALAARGRTDADVDSDFDQGWSLTAMAL